MTTAPHVLLLVLSISLTSSFSFSLSLCLLIRMVEYLTNEPYPFKNIPIPEFIGQIRMLDPRETFEKYERRSPQPPTTIERREYISCEYRREPVHQRQDRLACELRTQPIVPSNQRDPRMACEYRREPEHGQLACELRARPSTTVTTYLPENNKRKLPIGLIVGIAICIPIFIVIILFAAVWLQEVGIL